MPTSRVVSGLTSSLVTTPTRDEYKQLVANFTSNTFLAKGQGTFTPPSNDSADRQRGVLDHESIWRYGLQNEVLYAGVRRVQNLAPASEDLTDAAWAADTAANSTETATTLELTGINNAYHYKTLNPSGDITGRTFIASADMQAITGATSVGVRMYQTGAGGESDSAVIDLSDGETKRVSFNVTPSTDGALKFGIENRSAVISGVDTGVTKVTFTNIQIEESTGRLDTTTPSEYVSSGVATGEELVTNGTGLIDTTGYTAGSSSVLSANSGRLRVTNNVTNYGYAAYQVPVVAGKTYIASYEGFNGDNAANAVRMGTSAADLTYYSTSVPATAGTFSQIFQATTATLYLTFYSWGTGDSSYSEYNNITVKEIDHGSNVDSVKAFDYENPNSVTDNVVTDSGTRTPLTTLKGMFVEGAVTNEFLNSTAPVTQDITLSTGNHTLSVHGTGSVTSSNGTGSATGHGAASDGTDITFNVTSGGTITFTVSGSPDYVQVETGTYSTSPIVTAGTSVTRPSSEDGTIDDANIFPNFSLSVTVTPEMASTQLSGTVSVITLGANAFLSYNATSTRWEVTDGTNTATVTDTFIADQSVALKIIGSASGLQISADGTAGSAASYDGALPAGDITFKGEYSFKDFDLYRNSRGSAWL